MYADTNDDKLVNGGTGKGGFAGIPADEMGWVDWAGYTFETSDEVQIKTIKNGALWPYIKDTKLYQCPSGIRGEMRTYSIVDSMNGFPAYKALGIILKNRMQIRKPADRAVFIDEGRVTLSSWSIPYDREAWWGAVGGGVNNEWVPVRHGNGTTFSFADGHSEYWKWTDPRTIEFSVWFSDADPYQPGNPDLHRVQRAVWGELGYEPAGRQPRR